MEKDLVIYLEDTNEVIAIITSDMHIIVKKGYNCDEMLITSKNLSKDLATGKLKYNPPKKDNIIYLKDYLR